MTAAAMKQAFSADKSAPADAKKAEAPAEAKAAG
jgi:hypothetical protein